MVLKAIEIISFDDSEFTEMEKEAKSYKLSVDNYIRKLVWMARRVEDEERNRLEYEADKHPHLWKF